MDFSPKQKKGLRIFAWIAASLILIIVVINMVLGWMLETQISSFLQSKKDQNFQITVNKARVNILTGTLRLKGVSIRPDSSVMAAFKEGKMHHGLLFSLEIPVMKITNFRWGSFVNHKKLIVEEIIFKKPKFRLFSHSKLKKVKMVQSDEVKKVSLDSIYIKNLNGIRLGKISFVKCAFSIYDLDTETVSLENNDFSFSYEGIHFEELKGADDYFKLNLEHASLEVTNENFKLPGGWYQLGFSSLSFSKETDGILMREFYFKPQYKDLFKMAAKRPFRAAIFDVKIDSIRLSLTDLKKTIAHGSFVFDHIDVANMQLSILVDKHRPDDLDKRPKLPQQLLNTMTLPLHIAHLQVRNSRLEYKERGPKTEELMKVVLENLYAEILDATSIHDSIALGKPMTIKLAADFNGKSRLNVNFIMPLNSPVDTFYFDGSLGKADMRVFNSAVVPAIGVEFEKGTLNKLEFSANASPKATAGQMTMQYEGLEAKVIAKKEDKDENKLLSWVANNVVRESNPGKKGDLKIVPMNYERVIYKGFGNIVWKTLQSGIVNTVSPIGKTVEGQAKKKEKREKRADKKEEKVKKRKDRKRDRE